MPPDYLIAGILQRRFFYALTGQTGHAKTAVALLIARVVSCKHNTLFGTRAAKKGRVIYFVGENPDDVRMRVIGMDAKRDDDPAEDDIWFIPGSFNIAEMFNVLKADCEQNGPATLIIVDTSAAYFLGNEELSNTQMGTHARTLRLLTTLPGQPCVLALCHPVKHVVERSQLLPRGGGAFLAEVDGNLTLWRTGNDVVELHWQGKFRGPDFPPMFFRLEPIRDVLKDADGRPMPTVQAVAITPQEQEVQEKRELKDEDAVLAQMLKITDQSLSDIAEALGWRMDDGNPYKVKVGRILEGMVKNEKKQLVMQRRKKWVLTKAGQDYARQIALSQATRDANQQELGL